ncbi:unnamed protein product [Moneuplotes crassus]|uniref:Uncharacterized protein n=1 Tax=Euplotes crassus TaxID=5936 RepID=A0AAD1X5V5_EUPCR|nr:unnamed protein product [Moneuplotes crassus]
MNAPSGRIRAKSSNSFEFSEKSLVKSDKSRGNLSKTTDTPHFAVHRRKANTQWDTKPEFSLASEMESSCDTFDSSNKKIDKKRPTLKEVMKKLLKNKEKEANHAMILLSECMRDKLKISIEHCENLMKSSELKDLRYARDTYTGQGLLHFCCTQGHLELFEPLLEREPNLIFCKDDDGNTPFHNLCTNTKSNEAELISMFNLMKKEHVDIHIENSLGVTGLQILQERAKENNPYDNVQSVKKFLQHVITSCIKDDKLSETLSSLPLTAFWRDQDQARSTHSSSRSSVRKKKSSSLKKVRSKQRNLSIKDRKS